MHPRTLRGVQHLVLGKERGASYCRSLVIRAQQVYCNLRPPCLLNCGNSTSHSMLRKGENILVATCRPALAAIALIYAIDPCNYVCIPRLSSRAAVWLGRSSADTICM